MTSTAPHIRPVPRTLVEALHNLARHHDRGFTFVAADGSERFVSFQTIHAEALRRGAHLVARGLKKGDRVALVIPDPDEFVLSFVGCVMAGLVPVPMYPQLSFKNVESYHDTVSHIANASGARLLLTTPTTKPFVEPVKARAEKLEAIVTVDELAGPAPSPLDVTVTPDDLAFLQFTSGSTSRPKGVMVTHGNLAANAQVIMVDGLETIEATDKGVSWLPLFHDMGLIGFVISPLFCNIQVVFMPTASFVRTPRMWLDVIHKHRGTITYAPNFAYALVAKRVKEKDVAGLDLSCIKIAGCGAEPIQSKTLRDFAAKLAPAGFDPKAFLPSYGMAEATLAVTFVKRSAGMSTDTIDPAALQKGEAKPKLASDEGGTTQELVACGRWMPHHEVAIVDDDGKRLGDRQVGQILTRGPSISKGYFQEPELTAAAFKEGPDGATWLYTGDLGYIADGSLYICGRLKDIIIIRGRNFYPQDIEWAVSELPGVRRGNVVAFAVSVDTEGRPVSDGTGEEQLVICAEAFQSDAAGLTEQITTRVAAEMSLTVHKVVLVPQGSLPRTSSGKPQRRKTRQMFLDGTLPLARARGVHGGEAEENAADENASRTDAP